MGVADDRYGGRADLDYGLDVAGFGDGVCSVCGGVRAAQERARQWPLT